MAITVAQLSNLVASMLPDLGKGKLTDLSSQTRRYVGYDNIVNGGRVKHGPMVNGYKFQVRLVNTDNARFVGLFETDAVNVANSVKSAQVSERYWNTSAAWDWKEKQINESTPENQIFDLIEERYLAARRDLADKLESVIWGCPSAADAKTLLGLSYWIVYNASTNSSSTTFTGGSPSGYSDVAGLDPATYTRWRNYSMTYDQVTRDDLIQKIRDAIQYTNFETPYGVQDTGYQVGHDYGFYTTYKIVRLLERYLEKTNENLGTDVSKYQDAVMFKGVPVVAVPYFENVTLWNDTDVNAILSAANPFFGIDWRHMELRANSNNWGRTTISQQTNAHDTFTMHMDYGGNLITKDRRPHFVLSRGAMFA